MGNKVLNAKKLALSPEKEVHGLEPGFHLVEFDDGKARMTKEQLVISYLYWHPHRIYPDCPIKKSHACIGKYDAGTHRSICESMRMTIFLSGINPDNYWDNKYDIFDIGKAIYEVTNLVYNYVDNNLLRYSNTGSLHDIAEVLSDPTITKAKQDYYDKISSDDIMGREVEEAIAVANDKVADVLYNKSTLSETNNLKKMCRADIARKGGMLQLVGIRGFLQDINGEVFPTPINRGYAEGFPSLYDCATESRSAARALLNNMIPLQQSEWFNRQMQLVCSTIMSIKGDTCKGFKTLPYIVPPNHMGLLEGKFHMVDGKAVLVDETLEEGTVIQLRTLMGCNNHDPQTRCKTCIGLSSYFIPPGTNLGFTLCTNICAILSQLLLSTKHYEGSASNNVLELNSIGLKWLKLYAKDPGKVYMTASAARRNPWIRIPIESVKQLGNIHTTSVAELSPAAVTHVKGLSISPSDRKGENTMMYDDISTTVCGSGSALSAELLQYLKENGWEMHTRYIEFQLSGWDHTKPLMVTPRRGDNIFLYQQEVKSFFMPEQNSDTGITSCRTPGRALSEIVQLLEKRFKFNIINAEIYVAACMVEEASGTAYRLPRASMDFYFEDAMTLLQNRTVSSMLANQDQHNAVTRPELYMPVKRQRHMLDPILEGINGSV